MSLHITFGLELAKGALITVRYNPVSNGLRIVAINNGGYIRLIDELKRHADSARIAPPPPDQDMTPHPLQADDAWDLLRRYPTFNRYWQERIDQLFEPFYDHLQDVYLEDLHSDRANISNANIRIYLDGSKLDGWVWKDRTTGDTQATIVLERRPPER